MCSGTIDVLQPLLAGSRCNISALLVGTNVFSCVIEICGLRTSVETDDFFASSKHLTWAHIDLCTQQLSPMYHLEEGNIESSRNRYFLKK